MSRNLPEPVYAACQAIQNKLGIGEEDFRKPSPTASDIIIAPFH